MKGARTYGIEMTQWLAYQNEGQRRTHALFQRMTMHSMLWNLEQGRQPSVSELLDVSRMLAVSEFSTGDRLEGKWAYTRGSRLTFDASCHAKHTGYRITVYVNDMFHRANQAISTAMVSSTRKLTWTQF
jgi:hypothetical protein